MASLEGGLGAAFGQRQGTSQQTKASGELAEGGEAGWSELGQPYASQSLEVLGGRPLRGSVLRGICLCKVCLVCPRAQRRHCLPNSLAPSDGGEGAMRAYIETIAMILGLLGAYFALLPLTI